MLKVILIGYGRIGQMHAANINSSKKLELKYLFDTNKKLMEIGQKKYNCVKENNLNKMMKDNSVSIVFITSSTKSHIKYIKQATFFKKTIFCEKPLALNLQEVIKVKKQIKNHVKKIQMGFNRRHDPGHSSLKKMIKSNKIGRIKKIIITSRDPAPPSINYLKNSGGIFKDMMIHDFDLARYYLDKKDYISTIISQASSTNIKFKKINDYDIASVLMKSKKGVIIIINNSRSCSYGYDQRVEVFGEKGMLISGNKRINEIEIFNSNQTNSKKPLLNFFIERYKESYYNQLIELIKLAEKGLEPRSTFLDGVEALNLALAAKKSLIRKKQVILKK